MADDVIDGAPESAAEVTDLRSTIRAAVEAQRSPEPDPVETPEPVEAAPEKAVADKPETEAERNERLRDEKGKFATEKNAVKPEAKVEEPKVTAPKETTSGEEVKPPPSFSPTAKVVWNKESLTKEDWQAVKQDIAKRDEQVANGFAKLSEYKPIERFNEMAKQSGTTLDKALENYVGIEQELSRDMVSGIGRICQNQGVHPVALANAILARHGAAQSEGQAGETQANRTAPSVDLSPVMQKISALESYFQQQQEAGVQTEIQRFASDPKHTFFENVKADMGRLINSGYADDLEDAYEKACWANGEIRNLLIEQQKVKTLPSANAAEVVQKAKAAAKATGGAPSAGFKPNAGTEGSSIRDTIRAAVNSQRGI